MRWRIDEDASNRGIIGNGAELFCAIAQHFPDLEYGLPHAVCPTLTRIRLGAPAQHEVRGQQQDRERGKRARRAQSPSHHVRLRRFRLSLPALLGGMGRVLPLRVSEVECGAEQGDV